MIETIGIMEGQEVELQNLTAKVSKKEDLSRSQLEEYLELFKAGYGDEWLGDDLFWNVRLENASELLEIRANDQMAAAILFDNLRILQITVHPEFQGHGLGGRLLQEAAKAHSDAWISVALDAEGMLATVVGKDLNYMPVEDKDKIEALLRATNSSQNKYEIDTKEVSVPLLTERLETKGVDKDSFVAYAARTSNHGQSYYQVLFQNQPTTV